MDLTGQRFGKLIALERVNDSAGGNRWLCRCDCGNTHTVAYANLRNGHVTSCGCNRSRDLTGKVFGKLTVLSLSDQRQKRGNREYPLWVCRCECGEIVLRMSSTLNDEKERMCTKCLQKMNAVSMRDAAGFLGGTQLSKITDMRKNAANTSGTRGVYWHKKQNKWYARLKFQGKLLNLGSYSEYADAVKARQRAEEEIFGGFLSEMGLSEASQAVASDH